MSNPKGKIAELKRLLAMLNTYGDKYTPEQIEIIKTKVNVKIKTFKLELEQIQEEWERQLAELVDR